MQFSKVKDRIRIKVRPARSNKGPKHLIKSQKITTYNEGGVTNKRIQKVVP